MIGFRNDVTFDWWAIYIHILPLYSWFSSYICFCFAFNFRLALEKEILQYHSTIEWNTEKKNCACLKNTETFHCARIQSLIALQRINILCIDRWQTRDTRRSTIVTPKHINNTECNWIASVATHACIFKSDTLITYIDEWFMDPRLICAYYIYRKKGRF